MNDDVDFALLGAQLDALLEDETDALANTANFVALLNESLPDLNWVGVYVLRGNDLVLGPFQGKAACVRIPLGKGVCGTAAAERRTLRVPDVDAFPGHIVCDAASRAEIVVPLISGDAVLGVLDIDSPTPDRFSEADERGLAQLCERFVTSLEREGSTPPQFL